jgi:hypothetical protein
VFVHGDEALSMPPSDPTMGCTVADPSVARNRIGDRSR